MTKPQIIRIIKAKYDDYVAQIIADIKRLPDDCRQSGDDGLSDVWEEFKAQTQGEHSFSFEAYEETAQQLITALLRGMAGHEKELLWIESEGSWNHDDDEKLAPGQISDEVAEELYRRVCDVAANEPLETEEEELRITDEDLKVLHQVRDLLARTRPRFQPDSADEDCMQSIIKDLSNLPTLPAAEWSVNIVQHPIEKCIWTVIAAEDSITVDCRRSEDSRPEIEVRWKRGERHCRRGLLADWLAGASTAVERGADLRLTSGAHISILSHEARIALGDVSPAEAWSHLVTMVFHAQEVCPQAAEEVLKRNPDLGEDLDHLLGSLATDSAFPDPVCTINHLVESNPTMDLRDIIHLPVLQPLEAIVNMLMHNDAYL